MPVYRPSPKHCEPITAEKPGTKCPAWSVPIAQQLLDESVQAGGKRVATRDGVAFVARVTNPEQDVWHGYPEAWDQIDMATKLSWQREGKVTKRQLRRWATRDQIGKLWRDDNDD